MSAYRYWSSVSPPSAGVSSTSQVVVVRGAGANDTSLLVALQTNALAADALVVSGAVVRDQLVATVAAEPLGGVHLPGAGVVNVLLTQRALLEAHTGIR
jgi:hypothetical protein